jgi:hypothetical protein
MERLGFVRNRHLSSGYLLTPAVVAHVRSRSSPKVCERRCRTSWAVSLEAQE